MKISIITATYYSERTLRDTMESILCQTYQNYEYIIIDGASKDSTLDIIREYEPRFKGRMRYISEPDEGIYDAMNKGLAMATGDVIGLLNSDDYYTSPDVLESVVEGFKGEYVDAVYADIHYVNYGNPEKSIRYYSSSVFRCWMMRFGMMPAHPSFYCRKAVYDQYGFFETTYRIAADFEMLVRLLFIHRIRTRYIKKDFVTMRLGGASTTGYGAWSLIMKEHLQIMKHHGVVTNRFLLSLRYIYKLFEFL